MEGITLGQVVFGVVALMMAFGAGCDVGPYFTCGHGFAVCAFRDGRPLFHVGLYLFGSGAVVGLCRRYRGALCLLHPVDPFGQKHERTYPAGTLVCSHTDGIGRFRIDGIPAVVLRFRTFLRSSVGGTGSGESRQRACRNGEIPVRPAFRGSQRVVVGLHDRRHHDCT